MLKPLRNLGLGVLSALGIVKKGRISPFEKDRKAFEEEVKAQLLSLKKKGINLPVFTL